MSPRALVERVFPLVALCALVAIVAVVVTALGGAVLDRVVTRSLVNLVLVVGIYVFVGNSGVFSFGHIAFAAVGAYTAGILTIPVHSTGGASGKDVLMSQLPRFLATAHTSPLVATILGGAVAAAVAAVLSIPLMRLSGIAASIATFAILVIVNVVASNWQQVTGGTSGLANVPITTTTPVALVWALVAVAAAFAFQQTAVCLRLRASREDEVAARAYGVGVYLERRVAFTASAFLTGAGGALYGLLLGSFSPSAFFLDLTFITMAMLVIGGITSLSGAVVGTVFISAVQEALRRVEEAVNRPALTEVGLALIMLAVLVLRPGGLVGGRELSWWDPRGLVGSRRRDAPERALQG